MARMTWCGVSAVLAVGAMTLVPAGEAFAQTANASAAAVGLAGNFTAVARGFNAVAWNPAGLGMPGNPRFSLAIAPVYGAGGLNPIAFKDLKEYEGATVPASVREQWLQRVIANGSETGSAGGSVTELGLSIGPVGFQVSTAANLVADLAPDAMELVLFGNAGRTGTPRDTMRLAGSHLQAFAVTTAAASVAIPVPLRFGANSDQHFAVGVTGKYIIGNGYVEARDLGSVLHGADSLSIKFPMIQTDSTFGDDYNYGSGIAFDVGASWQGGPVTLSFAVQNLANSFEWDKNKLYYRPIAVLFSRDTNTSNTDVQIFNAAPPEVQRMADDFAFKRTVAVGAAWDLNSRITLSADIQRQMGSGVEIGPKSHIGAGVEFRAIPLLPVRAGFSSVTGGSELAAGTTLELGPVKISAGGGRRSTPSGTDYTGALALTFGTR